LELLAYKTTSTPYEPDALYIESKIF